MSHDDSSPGHRSRRVGGSLEDGVEAYESVRGLVLAAAYAADHPRAVQPARRPTEVSKLLREVRIGPPAEGGFVLAVHTPIPPRLSSAQPALFDVFTEVVRSGVSANLCEALVGLGGEGGGPGEISIAGTVDGDERLRRVWMSLAGEDHLVAARAHQEMSAVEVRGDLVRRGNRLFLTNPSGFRAVPDSA